MKTLLFYELPILLPANILANSSQTIFSQPLRPHGGSTAAPAWTDQSRLAAARGPQDVHVFAEEFGIQQNGILGGRTIMLLDQGLHQGNIMVSAKRLPVGRQGGYPVAGDGAGNSRFDQRQGHNGNGQHSNRHSGHQLARGQRSAGTLENPGRVFLLTPARPQSDSCFSAGWQPIWGPRPTAKASGHPLPSKTPRIAVATGDASVSWFRLVPPDGPSSNGHLRGSRTNAAGRI